MADDERGTRTLAAGLLLKELLIANPQYRRRWKSLVKRERDDEPSQAAVAEVLALHLWDSGERADTQTSLARGLRDRVRRALSGEKISPETLTWFIQAFGMNDRDEHSLWGTYAGSKIQEDSGIAHTLRNPREMAKRQWHRTIALFERYRLDDKGWLVSRHTMHTIMALEDGVDSYLFNHEPDAAAVEIIHGGRLGTHYEYGNGLRSDDIVLSQPLQRGQVISLEYLTSYRTFGQHRTEVRRPARARSQNIDVALQFNAEFLPRYVWWAVWEDHLDGGPVREQPVDLDERYTVHQFVPFIEQTVVGFRWEW